MILYCWIVIILLNTMRITFTNSTKATLTNINIVGGGGGHIDKLEVGESETVWIKIISEGSINIEYISNGKAIKENDVVYITNNIGQKMKYNIGGQKKKIFY